MTGSEWFLRPYPRWWRERYGDELVAMLEVLEHDGRLSRRAQLDVARAGLFARLGSAGRGHRDERPRPSRARLGASVGVLSIVALGLGVGIGGIVFGHDGQVPVGAVHRSPVAPVPVPVQIVMLPAMERLSGPSRLQVIGLPTGLVGATGAHRPVRIVVVRPAVLQVVPPLAKRT